jgi:hypothetical protein
MDCFQRDALIHISRDSNDNCEYRALTASQHTNLNISHVIAGPHAVVCQTFRDISQLEYLAVRSM